MSQNDGDTDEGSLNCEEKPEVDSSLLNNGNQKELLMHKKEYAMANEKCSKPKKLKS